MEKHTKRKGWLIFLTTVSIVSLLGAFAYAQGPWGGQQQGQGMRAAPQGQWGPPQAQGRGQGNARMLFRGMDLTDEQKEDLKALRDEHQDAVKEIRDEVRDVREELRDLMDDPIANKSDILKNMEKVSDLQAEQKILTVEHIYDAADLLDEEQLEKFEKRIKYAIMSAGRQQQGKAGNFKGQRQGQGYGQGYGQQSAPNQNFQRGPQGPGMRGGGF
jgi:periplasmic protein CpxP/Spy